MASSNIEIDNYAYIDILENDSLFGDKWRHFCQVLEFRKGMMHDLERMENRNCPFSVIIMKILQHWISIASAEANPRNFAKKLREIGCNDCAASVERLSGLSRLNIAEVGEQNTTFNANQQETNSEKDFAIQDIHINPIANLLNENLNKDDTKEVKIDWLSKGMKNNNVTDNANHQQETNSEKDFIIQDVHIDPIADLLYEKLVGICLLERKDDVWQNVKISWLSSEMINAVGNPKTMKLDIQTSLRVWVEQTPKKDRYFSKIRQVFAKQYRISDLLEENQAKWRAMT